MALDVSEIHRHLKWLATLAPDDPRWWRAGPKWTAARLRRFESTHFVLPADYRTWLSEVGDGGLLLQRDDFLSWKTWGAMQPLAGRKTAELMAAAQPFRIARDCKARHPVSGVLYLGMREGTDERYLVVTGKRAGEIWERSTYTDWFYRQGTFNGLVEDWIRRSTKVVEAWARPRDLAELAQLEPGARFSQLLGPSPACPQLIPWLRVGSDLFVDTFRELPREKRRDAFFAFEGALATYVEHLASSPALANTAAAALLGVIEERYRPRTEVEHALVAIFDAEQPNLSPAHVSRLIAALLPLGRHRTPDHDAAYWPALWMQMALVKTGRIDEALALLRVQPNPGEGDWVALARACIARGRSAEAFDAVNTLTSDPCAPVYRPGTYEIARAWLHLELGDRAAAIAALERTRADFGDAYDELIAAVRAHREGPTPEYCASCSADSVAPPFGNPRAYGMVALLYGVGGDGTHMVDAATRALSVHAVRRQRQEYVNQKAHLRMGHALLGKVERAPRLVVDYGANKSLATLAETILSRVGKLGIVIRKNG